LSTATPSSHTYNTLLKKSLHLTWRADVLQSVYSGAHVTLRYSLRLTTIYLLKMIYGNVVLEISFHFCNNDAATWKHQSSLQRNSKLVLHHHVAEEQHEAQNANSTKMLSQLTDAPKPAASRTRQAPITTGLYSSIFVVDFFPCFCFCKSKSYAADH
jgi:hypothetical protein